MFDLIRVTKNRLKTPHVEKIVFQVYSYSSSKTVCIGNTYGFWLTFVDLKPNNWVFWFVQNGVVKTENNLLEYEKL